MTNEQEPTAGSRHPYRARLGETKFGSPTITIHRRGPRAPDSMPTCRELTAFLYELAAHFERESVALGAGWAVAVTPWDNQIAIELGKNDDPANARKLVAEAVEHFSLA